MNEQKLKLCVVAGLGLAGGLALGLYLWGSEEENKKYTAPLERLNDVLKELDKQGTLTTENVTRLASKILSGDSEDAKPAEDE